MPLKITKLAARSSIKYIVRAISVAGPIAILLSGSAGYARPDPGFFYLICRGGERMNPIIQSQADSTRIFVNFVASSESWEAKPSLAPGECTWVDRAISDKESRTINFEIPADVKETISYSPNLTAFIFPFQKPVRVTRTRERVAVQVVHQTDGFSLNVMRPKTPPGRVVARPNVQGFDTVAKLDLSSSSYVTFSVKNIDGVFVANRLTKGVITGEVLRVETRPLPAPRAGDRRPAPRADDR